MLQDPKILSWVFGSGRFGLKTFIVSLMLHEAIMDQLDARRTKKLA